MRFTSTRNKVDTVSFEQAVLDCMPQDGGLYVPADTEDLRRWILYMTPETSFASIAGTLTSAFIKDEFSPIICETIATRAFPFEPVVKRLDDDLFMMELYHGPTGCHRDFGVAYLTAALETILQLKDSTAVLLDVSRGELGVILAHELKEKPHLKAVILYPKGMVRGLQDSDCVWNGGQILPIEVDGSEDDCRALVKNVFSDHSFIEKNHVTVSNTSNIGRLLPQAFFYPFAFSRLKERVNGDIYYALAPGNYSNVVAGLYSWRFALPLNGFILPATTALTLDTMGNTILLDSVVPLKERPAAHPSDPSNLERLEEVFCANRIMMRQFLYPVQITDVMVNNAAKELFMKYGVFADRHTARAYASLKERKDLLADDGGVAVLIARDHPALAADAIRRFIGEEPVIPPRISAAAKPVSFNRPYIRTTEQLRAAIQSVQ